MKLQMPHAMERERAILERQVKHLTTLVDDLLDVARITQQKVELAREPVELDDIVGKALELTDPLIQGRRHQVVRRIAPGLLLHADPVRLAQVMSNLLTNSAKYTEPGGRIEIVGSQLGDEVVVEVRDNGLGIPPSVLPHVFDRFIQGGQSLDRAMGGLGLGLTIVKAVVELHGGRVEAASEGPGRGSQFRVILPALPAELQIQPRAPSGPSAATPAPSGAEVLIVDDNLDALEMLAAALELIGFRPHRASDATAAVELAERVKPALAMVDIGLPLIDGYELAAKLRAVPGLGRIRLVAVTGYAQESDKQRAHQAGFDEHLVKPISLAQIERVLQRLAPEPPAPSC
jgi:CheY-like chemotaxis protein/two-component sensor histidine kinase